LRTGLPVAALSYAGMAAVYANVTHPLTCVILLFVPIGLGLGVTNAPLIARITTLVAQDKAPSASGAITTAAQLAQVVGVAAFGTLYFSASSGGGLEHGIVTVCLALCGLLVVNSVLVSRVRRVSS
jgi:predicted MFS family arabinose efflux permease